MGVDHNIRLEMIGTKMLIFLDILIQEILLLIMLLVEVLSIWFGLMELLMLFPIIKITKVNLLLTCQTLIITLCNMQNKLVFHKKKKNFSKKKKKKKKKKK